MSFDIAKKRIRKIKVIQKSRFSESIMYGSSYEKKNENQAARDFFGILVHNFLNFKYTVYNSRILKSLNLKKRRN